MRSLDDGSGEITDMDIIETATGVLLGQSLAPCPFCGEGRKFVLLVDLKAMETDPGQLRPQSVVACNACDAHGPGGFTLPEAIAEWNRRAGCG